MRQSNPWIIVASFTAFLAITFQARAEEPLPPSGTRIFERAIPTCNSKVNWGKTKTDFEWNVLATCSKEPNGAAGMNIVYSERVDCAVTPPKAILEAQWDCGFYPKIHGRADFVGSCWFLPLGGNSQSAETKSFSVPSDDITFRSLFFDLLDANGNKTKTYFVDAYNNYQDQRNSKIFILSGSSESQPEVTTASAPAVNGSRIELSAGDADVDIYCTGTLHVTE